MCANVRVGVCVRAYVRVCVCECACVSVGVVHKSSPEGVCMLRSHPLTQVKVHGISLRHPSSKADAACQKTRPGPLFVIPVCETKICAKNSNILRLCLGMGRVDGSIPFACPYPASGLTPAIIS